MRGGRKMLYKVKFFGAVSERHEQVRQVKTLIEAESRSKVEDELKKRYAVVKGLKIREFKEE